MLALQMESRQLLNVWNRLLVSQEVPEPTRQLLHALFAVQLLNCVQQLLLRQPSTLSHVMGSAPVTQVVSMVPQIPGPLVPPPTPPEPTVLPPTPPPPTDTPAPLAPVPGPPVPKPPAALAPPVTLPPEPSPPAPGDVDPAVPPLSSSSEEERRAGVVHAAAISNALMKKRIAERFTQPR